MLVDGLSQRRPGFKTRSVNAGYVVGKVTLGQIFLRVFLIFHAGFIPPWLSTPHPYVF
jgi:hypothetical protein